MAAAIEQAYQIARERYAAIGVNTDVALATLQAIPISLHCWQGDDVSGFEAESELTGSGLQVTGGYPGRARTPQELRMDIEMALHLIPGKHRVNLHANYAETGGKRVERDELTAEHFSNWITWASEHELGLDFNSTFFNHPKAAEGITLSHHDDSIRQFWVRHAIACREIGEAMGRALGSPCVVNVWIPDGSKDIPADRRAPRERLRASLDAIFAEKKDKRFILDAVESKLFGIGSESYVVGSHEFYLAYALQHGTLLTLDAGHFHPTESLADKISSVLLFVEELLLHVSRGIRWDSDHVVILTDELRALAEELVRCEALNRVHIGLDYFDASINRVAAWVIGMRAMQKALLIALLEPHMQLIDLEEQGDFSGRLATMEELKTMPYAAVWDFFCTQMNVPIGAAWLDDVRVYERGVLAKR